MADDPDVIWSKSSRRAALQQSVTAKPRRVWQMMWHFIWIVWRK
ncbi:MAG: hypothetical protein ACLT29_02280 [Ruminococcus callidus]